jgi:hypothetical protein
MDCRTARLLLSFARPLVSELETSDAEALEKHLADCLECESIAHAERQADERLRLAMRDVPISPDFRSRLLGRLSYERRAWYRRWPIRHPRITAAAAALLVAAVGFSVYLSIRPAPGIDAVAIRDRAVEQRGASSDVVEKWFRDKYGVQTVAPPTFDYAYLDSFDLNGDRVPQLLFIRGNYRAHVWILSSKQFDVSSLIEQPRTESGGHTVEFQAHPANPSTIYLIEYTGPSLAGFLVEGQPAT